MDCLVSHRSLGLRENTSRVQRQQSSINACKRRVILVKVKAPGGQQTENQSRYNHLVRYFDKAGLKGKLYIKLTWDIKVDLLNSHSFDDDNSVEPWRQHGKCAWFYCPLRQRCSVRCLGTSSSAGGRRHYKLLKLIVGSLHNTWISDP